MAIEFTPAMDRWLIREKVPETRIRDAFGEAFGVDVSASSLISRRSKLRSATGTARPYRKKARPTLEPGADQAPERRAPGLPRIGFLDIEIRGLS